MTNPAEDIELLPCRECGAACRIETFGPNKAIASEVKLFICSRHKRFGGHCPSNIAYFGAEAWNARASLTPTEADNARR